jgi:type I restriction enzyme S subunit
MARRTTVTGGRAATTGVIPGRWALSVGCPETAPPTGFVWTCLADVARLESGHTPSRGDKEYWNGDIPWIGIRDATANHGRTIYSTRESITEAGVANSSARVLPPRTVCLSRTASVGYVVSMGVHMATSQDFVNWVCSQELNPKYLHYLLMAEQDSIRRFAHGTTHQTLYYPEAKALHVCIPSRGAQDGIVEVLDALDDKIGANRTKVSLSYEVLRSTWQLTAKETAETVAVGDIADLDKGLSYKGAGLGSGAPLVNLGNFGVDGLFNADAMKRYSGESRERHWVQDGDLVLANTDLTQRREILGQPALVDTGEERALFSHHVYAVRGRTKERDQGVSLWLYAALREDSFRDRAVTYATGTTVAALPRDAVLTYEVPWPTAAERHSWASMAQDLVAEANHTSRESRALAAIRDALLPRLLSGELRVRDAEAAVEEVA